MIDINKERIKRWKRQAKDKARVKRIQQKVNDCYDEDGDKYFRVEVVDFLLGQLEKAETQIQALKQQLAPNSEHAKAMSIISRAAKLLEANHE